MENKFYRKRYHGGYPVTGEFTTENIFQLMFFGNHDACCPDYDYDNEEDGESFDDSGFDEPKYKVIKSQTAYNSCDHHNHSNLTAVISCIGELIPPKNGENMVKRIVQLIDDCNCRLQLELWGKDAIAVKETEVGKVMSLTDAKKVKQNVFVRTRSGVSMFVVDVQNFWKEVLLKFKTGLNYARKISFIGLPEERSRTNQMYFKGMILSSNLNERFTYEACQFCSKKIVKGQNGDVAKYYCTKCHTPSSSFNNAFCLHLDVGDFTDTVRATFFDNTAVPLLQRSANEVVYMKEHDPEKLAEMFRNVQLKSFLFRMTASESWYAGKQQKGWICNSVEPVNYTLHNAFLQQKLKTWK